MDEITNKIHPAAIIGHNVQLGEGNEIGPYTVIGEMGFIRCSKKRKGKIIIGDNNRIGSHVTVMAGEEGETRIGSDNMIMNHANIGHNSFIGDQNEIGPACILCGYVQLGNQNKVKTAVTVRNRIQIGDNNLIGMGSVVTKSIGSDQKVYGNPARCVSPMPSELRSSSHNGLSENES